MIAHGMFFLDATFHDFRANDRALAAFMSDENNPIVGCSSRRILQLNNYWLFGGKSKRVESIDRQRLMFDDTGLIENYPLSTILQTSQKLPL
jgi:hypothetical protein